MSLQGIYLASRSVSAQQRALEVTGQNITNVNTPGYTRQIAVLTPVSTEAATAPGGSGGRGGGVDVALVMRSRASWLERSADSLRSQVGDARVATQLASRLEQLTGEPGPGGIQASLDQFFNAGQAAGNQPGDTALRAGLVRSGSQVLARFEAALTGLSEVQQETLSGAQSDVVQVNAIARQVAGLSQQIGSIQAAGQPANELLDQRDALLETLTGLTGASVSGRAGGDLVVSVGGISLVQGGEAQALQVRPEGTLASAEGTLAPAVGGELGGRLKALQSTLPELTGRLRGIRDALVGEVNALHRSGVDLSGAAGDDFFVRDSQGTPGVNPALQADPRRLALGDGTAGDGSVGRAIAGLRESATIVGAYQSLAGEIGTRVVSATNRAAMASASLSQVQSMQAAESGVNLDEELANMVAQQHVYAASARLLSTYDQMLDTLIQRTGN